MSRMLYWWKNEDEDVIKDAAPGEEGHAGSAVGARHVITLLDGARKPILEQQFIDL